MRFRDAKHRKFIASLPCLVCLDPTSTECAHVSFSCAAVAKPIKGHHKAADYYCVPLCGRCHRLGPKAQHTIGERKFWAKAGEVLVIAWALKLFACFVTDDREEAERTVMAANEVMRSDALGELLAGVTNENRHTE